MNTFSNYIIEKLRIDKTTIIDKDTRDFSLERKCILKLNEVGGIDIELVFNYSIKNHRGEKVEMIYVTDEDKERNMISYNTYNGNEVKTRIHKLFNREQIEEIYDYLSK